MLVGHYIFVIFTSILFKYAEYLIKKTRVLKQKDDFCLTTSFTAIWCPLKLDITYNITYSLVTRIPMNRTITKKVSKMTRNKQNNSLNVGYLEFFQQERLTLEKNKMLYSNES